jgi:hypothetical protein
MVGVVEKGGPKAALCDLIQGEAAAYGYTSL